LSQAWQWHHHKRILVEKNWAARAIQNPQHAHPGIPLGCGSLAAKFTVMFLVTAILEVAVKVTTAEMVTAAAAFMIC